MPRVQANCHADYTAPEGPPLVFASPSDAAGGVSALASHDTGVTG
jgi:hypothetical protein